MLTGLIYCVVSLLLMQLPYNNARSRVALSLCTSLINEIAAKIPTFSLFLSILSLVSLLFLFFWHFVDD